MCNGKNENTISASYQILFFFFLAKYRSNWYGQGEIIRHLVYIFQLDENERIQRETKQQDRDGENLYYNAFKV